MFPRDGFLKSQGLYFCFNNISLGILLKSAYPYFPPPTVLFFHYEFCYFSQTLALSTLFCLFHSTLRFPVLLMLIPSPGLGSAFPHLLALWGYQSPSALPVGSVSVPSPHGLWEHLLPLTPLALISLFIFENWEIPLLLF